MSTELAKAYVQIVPTAKGIKGSLENMLGGEADVAGTKAGKSFASKFGSAMGTVGKLAGAGIAAAATGVAALGKQAVSAYADFQQLEGGIETLFGENAPAVMQSAANAFQTAGLSANDYMETAIQSSAAMIASLDGDTEAAASLVDMSITDMADNVNKMGTTMEAVQNAYRGFSRGNFTMLDNLALGFAGTKEGMQELLDKAQELSGVEYDIGSYADIVNAIHVVQTEMGITGTTAEEAAGTISGSIATMKAAWQNLLTGIANGNADVGGLTANLVSSVKTVGKNLLPTVKTMLKGMTEVIRELAPAIGAELPALVADILPDLVTAGVELAVGLGTALVENAPTIIQALTTAIISNAPALLEGGVQLALSLVSGLVSAVPQLLVAAGELLVVILQEIGKGVVQLAAAGGELVAGLWNGISGAAGWLWGKITEWLSSIWDGIKEFFGVASPSKEMAWMGEMLDTGLAQGITSSADDAVSAATAMSADVLAAMQGGQYAMNATGAAEIEIRHTGTIRVEGVSSEGELVAVTDILYEQLVTRLRQEVRYA